MTLDFVILISHMLVVGLSAGMQEDTEIRLSHPTAHQSFSYRPAANIRNMNLNYGYSRGRVDEVVVNVGVAISYII